MLGAGIGALLAGAWLTYAFVGGFEGERGLDGDGSRDWLVGGVAGFAIGGLLLAGAASPNPRRLAFYTAAAVPLGVLAVVGTFGGHPWLLGSLLTIAALLLYAPALREIRRERGAAAPA